MAEIPTTPESGEFALIERIIERLGDAAATSIIVPSGDDAAIWETNTGAAVATIDTLTAGTHWRTNTMDYADIGWRTVVANVSDLAAMGAEPKYLLVATCLGPSTTTTDLDLFIDGAAEACRSHNVRIAGGDIVRGETTTFTIAAYGDAQFDGTELLALRRESARVGDLVAVSGHPGASASGLMLIERGQSETTKGQALIAAHRRPRARFELGQRAIRSGIRSAIDISDGLLQDLDHVAKASAVGIEINCESLPIHSEAVALIGKGIALELALGGGEDFELALIGSEPALDSLADEVTVIGHVVKDHPGETVVLDQTGSHYQPPYRGWDQLLQGDNEGKS